MLVRRELLYPTYARIVASLHLFHKPHKQDIWPNGNPFCAELLFCVRTNGVVGCLECLEQLCKGLMNIWREKLLRHIVKNSWAQCLNFGRLKWNYFFPFQLRRVWAWASKDLEYICWEKFANVENLYHLHSIFKVDLLDILLYDPWER